MKAIAEMEARIGLNRWWIEFDSLIVPFFNLPGLDF